VSVRSRVGLGQMFFLAPSEQSTKEKEGFVIAPGILLLLFSSVSDTVALSVLVPSRTRINICGSRCIVEWHVHDCWLCMSMSCWHLI